MGDEIEESRFGCDVANGGCEEKDGKESKQISMGL